ncbi:MAG: AbrB/MazE/SpoVT family DNA-binding domain-containing protein [bacterium]
MAFGIVNGMNMEVNIDRAGRVVLPQGIRRMFNIVAGDRLGLEVVSNGILLHSPARQSPLTEEDGLLVHEGTATGDLSQAVELARDDRDANVLGLRR